MRTETINVYSISELSEKAKAKAYDKWLKNSYYDGAYNEGTLKKFEELFPVKIKNWSYGGRWEGVYFYMTTEDSINELSGPRLMAYIQNNYGNIMFKGKYFSLWSKTEKSERNPSMGKLKSRRSKVLFDNCCVLTGYYIDNYILAPIYEFLEGKNLEKTFEELMGDCFYQWVKGCNEDYEDSISMERFIEESEDNELVYTSDGNKFETI